jgi:hypothetical protein
MIKISNLEKIYRTDEVETVALNKLSLEVKKASLLPLWALRMRQIHFTEYCRIAG